MMGDRSLHRFLIVGAGLVALLTAGSLWQYPAAALGVLAGGAWSLANLWCLARALIVWLGPTPSPARPASSPGRARWHAAWWFLVKFPGLYGLAIGLLLAPGVSLEGFGLGFSAVLAWAVVAGIVWSQERLRTLPTHGG